MYYRGVVLTDLHKSGGIRAGNASLAYLVSGYRCSNDIGEQNMAFIKTGIALSQPKPVELPTIGEERDGKVWDGEKWVTKAEWEAKQAGKSGNG